MYDQIIFKSIYHEVIHTSTVLIFIVYFMYAYPIITKNRPSVNEVVLLVPLVERILTLHVY